MGKYDLSNKNLKIKPSDLEGFKNLKNNVIELIATKIRIGVFGGNYPTGESIASVGLEHEFGTVSNKSFTYKGEKITISGVPQRSWLRMPLKSNKFKIVNDKVFLKYFVTSRLKSGDIKNLFDEIGLDAVATIQEAFITKGWGNWDNNISEKYIKLKGTASSPLIDTSLLLRSVTYEIKKK